MASSNVYCTLYSISALYPDEDLRISILRLDCWIPIACCLFLPILLMATKQWSRSVSFISAQHMFEMKTKHVFFYIILLQQYNHLDTAEGWRTSVYVLLFVHRISMYKVFKKRVTQSTHCMCFNFDESQYYFSLLCISGGA